MSRSFLLHISSSILLAGLLFAGAACQSTPPVKINNLPAYPGATELELGKYTGTDSELSSTMSSDASYRKQVGADTRVVYKAFRLSTSGVQNANLVYLDQLKAAGWSASWGSVPGFYILSRGSQTLILHWLHSRPDQDAVDFFVSLNLN